MTRTGTSVVVSPCAWALSRCWAPAGANEQVSAAARSAPRTQQAGCDMGSPSAGAVRDPSCGRNERANGLRAERVRRTVGEGEAGVGARGSDRRRRRAPRGDCRGDGHRSARGRTRQREARRLRALLEAAALMRAVGRAVRAGGAVVPRVVRRGRRGWRRRAPSCSAQRTGTARSTRETDSQSASSRAPARRGNGTGHRIPKIIAAACCDSPAARAD